MAKAAFYILTDAEMRKHGEQTGLETLVVHAVNYECYCVLIVFDFLNYKQLTRETLRLRSTIARLKLKGFDGGP
jgi:hypothetical protein